MANRTLSEPSPKGAFRDQGFRRGLAAKSIRLDIDPQSNRQQKRVVPQFKKSLMSAPLLTGRDTVRQVVL